MTHAKTARPSTPCENEILIPTVRIGVLHDPNFKDMDVITRTILASRWHEEDPEFCFVKNVLGHAHPVGSVLSEKLYVTGYFVANKDDKGWLRIWEEVVEYSTHLLVFIRRGDTRLKNYLTSDNCPKRPTKVITID